MVFFIQMVGSSKPPREASAPRVATLVTTGIVMGFPLGQRVQKVHHSTHIRIAGTYVVCAPDSGSLRLHGASSRAH